MLLAAALVAAVAGWLDPAPGGAGATTAEVEVILLGESDALTSAVVEAGGTVARSLPTLDAVVATVPASELSGLAAHPATRSIAPNAAVTVAEGESGDPPPPALPPSVHRDVVRAGSLNALGHTGTGSTVALIDTGVADLAALSHALVRPVDPRTGRTSNCINFSGETGCGDSYGHGTFLAGLIAARGGPGSGTGVAPDARILSVKIAGRDGSADVGTILAAIEWVVSFRSTYGIRVVNLALGTDSTQSYTIDPLNYAVERAWSAGVVVVVAASNRGPSPGTISKPADDPWVITVGAMDDSGTLDTGDDRIPDFSGRGPTADGIAKPDVVAPGARLVSLRAPGSATDTAIPPAVDDPVYRAGSGTSMATAVVSGAVALMLQVDPAMSPDRVKYALTSTARPAPSDDRMAVGAGVVDVRRAALEAPAGLANTSLVRSTGDGTLDASRGSARVRANGTVVSGTLTQQLVTYDRPGYKQRNWTASSWSSSPWHGSSWYGSSWYGSSWYGSSWYGSSWYGVHYDSSWYGSSWYGSSWYGAWE